MKSDRHFRVVLWACLLGVSLLFGASSQAGFANVGHELYGWGLLDVHKKNDLSSYISKPTPLDIKDVMQVEYTGRFGAYVTKGGEVYGFGASPMGKTDAFNDNLYRTNKQPQKLMDNVKSIDLDWLYLVALHNDGTLKATHLGMKGMMIGGITLDEELGQGISNFSFESDHLLALDANGKVFYAGVHPVDKNQSSATLRPIWPNQSFTQVAVDRDFVLGLMKDGTVKYLGKPLDVGGQADADGFVVLAQNATRIYAKNILSKDRNLKFGTTGAYLTTDRDLYGFGNSAYGQLGVVGDVSTPRKIASGVYGASVNDGSILIAKTDGIFAQGFNGSFELGIGNTAHALEFEKTKLKDVVKAESAAYSNVFLTKKGEVFGVGDNSIGEIGDIKASGYYEPHLMATNAIDIAKGIQASVVLTKDKIIVFGHQGSSTKKRMEVDNDNGYTKIQVSDTQNYTIYALNPKNELYAMAYAMQDNNFSAPQKVLDGVKAFGVIKTDFVIIRDMQDALKIFDGKTLKDISVMGLDIGKVVYFDTSTTNHIVFLNDKNEAYYTYHYHPKIKWQLKQLDGAFDAIKAGQNILAKRIDGALVIEVVGDDSGRAFLKQKTNVFKLPTKIVALGNAYWSFAIDENGAVYGIGSQSLGAVGTGKLPYETNWVKVKFK